MMDYTKVGDELGLKGASVLAGFAGAVVSLSFVKELSRVQMLVAVAVGSVAAGYLTPISVNLLHLPAELQNGAAFIVGLTAMNLIPGILKLTEWFRQDPWSVVDKVPYLSGFLGRGKKEG